MFEKEAEEYTLKRLVCLEDFDSYQSAYDRFENGVQDAFKDGAEFGYNKALEQCAEKFAESKMDNVCKFVFHELATFVDWYAESEEQNEHYMSDILVLVNKIAELTKENE